MMYVAVATELAASVEDLAMALIVCVRVTVSGPLYASVEPPALVAGVLPSVV